MAIRQLLSAGPASTAARVVVVVAACVTVRRHVTGPGIADSGARLSFAAPLARFRRRFDRNFTLTAASSKSLWYYLLANRKEVVRVRLTSVS